ncbi:phosphoglucosamine mutase [Dysgonomonas massiliensis]|uniref:phosphoglucosamine mutase n=1 Tax=Dysgonomonas massiliensis TaxID=2040292 RepID=UPI000C7726E3|nr:phosphoglucosamine mutase [Dysgonomonas massiliensis]
MSLIKSISGIRGTIGGKIGEGLNPLDTVKFVSAYATYIKSNKGTSSNAIVVGRDARISGEMMEHIVVGTLIGMGFDVVNIGLATTPTTEIAVVKENACGGIILTASHNPKQWNALKLLNSKGEFLNAEDGAKVLEIAEKEDFTYSEVDSLGKISTKDYTDIHIQEVLNLDLVDVEAIKAADFEVSIDCVNSVGGIVIPKLLKALGVNKVNELYTTPNGQFPHNPEPLPEHLDDISKLMKETSSDVGFVVDPDVDRLAIICENGDMFGEEYTLVAIADYVLQHTPGSTVSNLSSSRALRDVTYKYDCPYYAAAVGEVNVTTKMKEVNAVIGGEGNGGIIYPASHYGRDALVGIALFLTYLAKQKKTVSELRASYPAYYIAKQKVELTPQTDVDAILDAIRKEFDHFDITDIDGVKIDFPDKWVHLRKSNTEPIIRVYSEAKSMQEAEEIGAEVMNVIRELTK